MRLSIVSIAAVCLLVPWLPVSLAEAEMISNGDFEQGNTDFTTGYAFSPGNTGPAQSYDITLDPGASHPAPNDPSYGDHTTGSGFMAAFNGSEVDDVVAWLQTVDVAPNTPYAFSAWISNWARGGDSPAVLDFLFNGVAVGTFTESSTPGVWEEFATIWQSADNTSVTIEIVDRNLVGLGNDFALDDISLRAVPEPSSALMLLTAAIGVAACVWRRLR